MPSAAVIELANVVPAPVWSAWEPLALSMLTSGAAALLLACLAALPGKGSASPEAQRPLALAALCAGLAGQAALFVSLEQPLRAYEFFLTPSSTSWTALGAYMVPLFLLAALLAVVLTRRGPGLPRAFAAAAVLPAAGVFVYATNEIMACVGRALWTGPLTPLVFLAAGLAGGAGLSCAHAALAGNARAARPLGLLAALGALLCALLAFLLFAPGGFAAYTDGWWHAPEVLCLIAAAAATVVLLAGLESSPLFGALAGIAGLLASLLLFWKLIAMGQSFARNASTFSDGAAFLDILSGRALLAMAGTAGLLLALGVLVPALLPVRIPARIPDGMNDDSSAT
ncbi:Polysulfide reductase NrfD [Desulfovibrio sp. X2]|uniref:polysulfide reductase NrfD n=1 Tax=Desulfovibrio sp. X2 TaxID=941449 RepID=UPI0003589675|nr:polysulfide reductase NrfD [Desulfovibrio sp. X2]EPR44542.1 Polysulfide reductase NrfD [Desulfovibrio sp. X2]